MPFPSMRNIGLGFSEGNFDRFSISRSCCLRSVTSFAVPNHSTILPSLSQQRNCTRKRPAHAAIHAYNPVFKLKDPLSLNRPFNDSHHMFTVIRVNVLLQSTSSSLARLYRESNSDRATGASRSNLGSCDTPHPSSPHIRTQPSRTFTQNLFSFLTFSDVAKHKNHTEIKYFAVFAFYRCSAVINRNLGPVLSD